MGPQEDYIETVVTCEGDFNDPGLPDLLKSFKDELESLLLKDKKKELQVKKVEPWNSLKVTLNIPRSAALRLKQMAEQRDPYLHRMGVKGVQIQGDHLVPIYVTSPNNQQAKLGIGTPDADQFHHPPLSASVRGSAVTDSPSARPLSSLQVQDQLSPEGQFSSLIPSSLVARRLATGPSFEAVRLAALHKEPPLQRNNISDKEVHPSLERVVSTSTQSDLAARLLILGASSRDNVTAYRNRAHGDQNPPFHYPLLQQPVPSAPLQPMVHAPFHQQRGSPQDVALPHTAAAGGSLTSHQVTTPLPLTGAKGTNKTRKNGKKRNRDATKDVSDSESMKETINNGLAVNDKPPKKARRRRTDKQVASGSSIDYPSTVSMNGSQKVGKRATFSDGPSQGNSHIQANVRQSPMLNAALVSAALTQKTSKEGEDSLVNPHTGIMEPRNSCPELSGDSAYALPMSPVTDHHRNVLTAVQRKMSPMYRVHPPAPSQCSSTSGPPISHQALAADPHTRPHLIPAGQGNRTGLGQAVSCQIGSHQPFAMKDPPAKKPRLVNGDVSVNERELTSPLGSRLWSDGEETSNSPVSLTYGVLGPLALLDAHGKLDLQDSGLGSQSDRSDRSIDTTPSDGGGGQSPLNEPLIGKSGVDIKNTVVNCSEVPLQDPMLSVGYVRHPATIPAARAKVVLESLRQRPEAEGGQFRKMESQEPRNVRQQEQDMHMLVSSAITSRHRLLQQSSAVLARSKQAGQDREQAISGVPCAQQLRISPPHMMPQSRVSTANDQRLLEASQIQSQLLQRLAALRNHNGSVSTAPNGSMSGLCVPPTSTMPGQSLPPNARYGATAAPPSVAADCRESPRLASSLGAAGQQPVCQSGPSSLGAAGQQPVCQSGPSSLGAAGQQPVCQSGPSSLGAAGQQPVCQSGPSSVGRQRGDVGERDRVNQIYRHLSASPSDPPSSTSPEGAGLPEDLKGLYDSPANKGSPDRLFDLLNEPLDTDPEKLPDIHQIVDQLKSDFAENKVPANSDGVTNITATRFPQPLPPVSVGVLHHNHPAGLPQPRRLTESVQRVVQPLPAQDYLSLTGSGSTHTRPGISHHGTGPALGVAGQSEVKSGMDSTWVSPASTFQGLWDMNPAASYGVKPDPVSPGMLPNTSAFPVYTLTALQSAARNRAPSHGPVRAPHLQASVASGINQQFMPDWYKSPGSPVVGDKAAASYIGTVGMGPSPAAALGAGVPGKKRQTKAKAKKNGSVTQKKSQQQ